MPPHRYKFHTEPVAHKDAVVQGDKYRFTILTDGLVRMEWAEDGKFEDRASTFAVRRSLAVPKYYLYDHGEQLEIVTERLQLYYDKKKFTKQGLYVNLKGNVAGVWRYGDEINDLGGTIRTLDNVNGRTNMGHGVISEAGFGIINDSKSFLFEDDGWVGLRRSGDRSDEYLWAYGHDYRAAVRAFYAVSGSQSLLPRFTLGNWWTRFHKYTSDEYLTLMDRFRGDEVPFSILVIDIYWHKVDIPSDWPGSGWTGFTWDRNQIPDPVGFLRDLANRNLHRTLNNHPAEGIRWFEDCYEKVAKHMGIDPSTKQTVEFDCTSRRFMDAYFDIVLHQFEKEGIDFWWVDWQQGEQSKIPEIDPLWMLNHYHHLDNARGKQRSLILSRFAGPGSQRYQVGFSGDVVTTWESIHFQPEFTATASNIGYAWWSHDIGGHTSGFKDDELITRWYQLGCYSPVLRIHCSNAMFNFREPWKFNDEACAIIEETLRIRHRLVPYLYTMNARSALHDEPLIQPIYWEYPDTALAYKHRNSYFYGTELLVTPVTRPRATDTHLARTDMWFPPGRWVDIYTGLVYTGDRDTSVYRSLSQTPAFASPGAIIPLDGSSPIPNGVPNPSTFEVLLVVGADGTFSLAEDDGSGSHVADGNFTMVTRCDAAASDSETDMVEEFAPAASASASAPNAPVEFSTTTLSYKHSTGVLSVSATTPMTTSIPASRSWRIRVLAQRGIAAGAVKCTLANGWDQPVTLAHVENGTLLSLGDIPSTQSFEVKLGPGIDLDVLNATERCWDILFNTNAHIDWKADVWNALNAPGTLEERIERVKGRDVGEDLLGALLDSLQADERYAQQIAR